MISYNLLLTLFLFTASLRIPIKVQRTNISFFVRSLLLFLFISCFLLHSSESLEAMDGHKSRVFSACFNPRSAHELISGGWDNTIQFWDTRQPYALRRISGVHMCGDGLDISRNGREVHIFISRIQSPTISTLTPSYSHDKYIKIVRVRFLKPNSGPRTTHPLSWYAFRRVEFFNKSEIIRDIG